MWGLIVRWQEQFIRGAGTPPPASGSFIQTESANNIITEGGDSLITE